MDASGSLCGCLIFSSDAQLLALREIVWQFVPLYPIQKPLKFQTTLPDQLKKNDFYGGPGRSPTCDLRVRSALLYATELPGHVFRSIVLPPHLASVS